MSTDLNALKAEALGLIKTATANDIENLRVKYLGRKGALTALLRSTRDLPPEERPEFGRRTNEVKRELEEAFARKLAGLQSSGGDDDEISGKKLDVTLPGIRPGTGTIHPITRALNEMISIFSTMGYRVAKGPEVEWDKYNFTLLNFPENHPARDMQDTFFVSEDIVLRTHTSPVQIRAMLEKKPPFRIISPGKVYRRDRDTSHSPMFFQLEGFVVDEGVSMADLKGTLAEFVRGYFGPETDVRLRPSFFPFTEPSAELDISCVLCGGDGCRMCKMTGWLEILGAGMIHPQVLKNVDIDPERWTGFAFGTGIERPAILKYGIEPISTFYENDLRFLKQF